MILASLPTAMPGEPYFGFAGGIGLAPVRPGDTLHTLAEVREMRPSSSKPTQGTVRMHYSAVNQHGDSVIALTTSLMIGTGSEEAANNG